MLCFHCFNRDTLTCVFIFCADILVLCCVVPSPLPVNLLVLLYRRHPPPLLHSPADVRRGHPVVPAVYLLPFRGFTREATAQINSLNSHSSVGTSLSLPHLLANSLSPPLSLPHSESSIRSLHLFFLPLLLISFPALLSRWLSPSLSVALYGLSVFLYELMLQHLTPEQSHSTMASPGFGKRRTGSAKLLKPYLTWNNIIGVDALCQGACVVMVEMCGKVTCVA